MSSAERDGLDAATRLELFDSTRWAELVGDDLASAGRPVRLEGGVLVVEAFNEMGSLRLLHAREGVRARLNEEAGDDVVRRIVVRRAW